MKSLLILILAVQLILLPISTSAGGNRGNRRGRNGKGSGGKGRSDSREGGQSGDESESNEGGGDTYLQKARDYLNKGKDEVLSFRDSLEDLGTALGNVRDAFNGELQDAIDTLGTKIDGIRDDVCNKTYLSKEIQNVKDELASIRSKIDETAIPLINKVILFYKGLPSILSGDFKEKFNDWFFVTIPPPEDDDDGDEYTSAKSIGINGMNVNDNTEELITFTMHPSELYMLGLIVIAIMIVFNTVLSIIIGKFCCNSAKYNYGPVKYDSNTDA